MEEFQVRLEQIGGCGDGGCMIHVRPGMHTNGGCRCSTDPFKMRQTVHVYKGAVAEQAQEIERLREALKTVTVNLIACHSLLGAGGKIAAASDKMFKIMMSDYAKAIEVGRSTAWPETRAALQPKEDK